MNTNIDTITDAEMQFYLAKGRAERSEAAHAFFASIGKRIADIFSNERSAQLSHG
ncbi:MAG: hypothetical protein AAGA88_13330 [Pseudomonadota bacterium]